MDEHYKYMRRAIQISAERMRVNSGGPFGAVIVKDGAVIAEGFNQVTSANDPTAHAEVDVIRAAGRILGTFDLSGCAIYTSCEPCPMCLAAIYWARLDRCYFANTRADAANIGFDDALIYEEVGKEIADRKLPMERILLSEATDIFEEWSNKEDKVEY